MDKELVAALRARRSPIRERWEALLRTERASTPLANPDFLIHLLDGTLNEVFGALRATDGRVFTPAPAVPSGNECPCAMNPLIAYFAAGEQAMLEGLIMVQVSASNQDPTGREMAVADLLRELRTVAHREISAFCSVCQQNPAGQPKVVPLPAGTDHQG